MTPSARGSARPWAATTTSYQYSGGPLLAETTGGTETDYIYLNGRPLAMLTGTTFTWLHDDKLGTPAGCHQRQPDRRVESLLPAVRRNHRHQRHLHPEPPLPRTVLRRRVRLQP